MTDSALNKFLAAGTAADRAAFTPSPPTPASGAAQGYIWHETDTGDTYSWKAGTGWIKVNGIGTGPSTSLSQISSSLSTTNSTNVTQSTSLSQISSSLSGAISSTTSLSTAVSTVVSGSISIVTSSVNSLSAAVGGSTTWALAGTGQTATGIYDFATDGAKASIDFVGLTGIDILIIAKGITKASTGVLITRASVDNGSTFYSTAGDYVSMSSAGVETNDTHIGAIHNTNATAARSGVMMLPGAGVNGTVKGSMPATSLASGIFLASTSPINAIRFLSSGGGNITGGKIYVFAR